MVSNGISAVLWGAFTAYGAARFAASAKSLSEATQLDHSDVERPRKIFLSAKQALTDGSLAVCIATYALRWAHDVQWISLGLPQTLLLQGVGAVAIGITSGISAAEALCDLTEASKCDLNQREEIEARKTLGFLDLVWTVSSIAWSVLQVVTLLGVAPVSSFVMGGLLATSTLFWVGSFLYRYHKQIGESHALVNYFCGKSSLPLLGK